MSEESGFFGDATDVRYYTQEPMQRFVMDFRENGYVDSSGNELAVVQHSTGDMSVDVGTGEAWIQGCHYLNADASVNLAVSTAHATLARIDRVVLRNTIIGTRKIEPVVITGIPASAPVAPSYVRTTSTYDLVLADVAVAAGATAILTANITDQRSNTTYCGVAQPISSRMADICPVDAPDMNSYKITGSADPSSGGDGVTVSHRSGVSYSVPAGVPIWYAGATVPTGYLECNGQAVSRTTYPTLFAAMGTAFGSGDGSTTFNLPDGSGRCIFGYNSTDASFNSVGKTGGEKTHALIADEMPGHVHSGVITAASVVTGGSQFGARAGNITINSDSTGSIGSGTAHNNLQPYVVMKLIVRGV